MSINFVHSVVTITKPPENTTFCRGRDVTISCHYMCTIAFLVTWIINGTSFDQSAIVNSPLYQLNNPTIPTILSLMVYSINDTTTFQCSVANITSGRGTVTVIGMYIRIYTYVYK